MRRFRLPIRSIKWVFGLALVVGSGFGLLAQDHSADSNARLQGATPSVEARASNSAPDAVRQPLSRQAVTRQYLRLPLAFESNRGQTDNQVRFLARGIGYTLFLTDRDAVLAVTGTASGAKGKSPGFAGRQRNSSTALRLHFVGADPSPRVSALDEMPGKSNYFLGNDPARWKENIPNYAKVQYEGIYPGINLVYYGSQRQLEEDFVVSPGADPSAIAFDVEGAQRLWVDASGDLHAAVQGGELLLRKPSIYQPATSGAADGRRTAVKGRFVLTGATRVGVRVGEYDRSRPLVIDPVLVYSTYLSGTLPSGTQFSAAFAIGLDSSDDNVYVAGNTTSTNFPTTTGAYQTACMLNDGVCEGAAFVTKLSSTGSEVFSTYLGGSGSQSILGLAVGLGEGHIYLVGETTSTDFPTVNAYQTACADGGNPLNCLDAFVARLSSDGSTLAYSTYLGGSNVDLANSVVFAGLGESVVVVAGQTVSTDFPTTPGVLQTTCSKCSSGKPDGFVAEVATKLSGASSLVYSTYLGGSTGTDYAFGSAVDSSGDAYVTGSTSSTDFPVTAGAFQTACKLDSSSVCEGEPFVAKLNPSASALLYATYVGGSGGAGNDAGKAITVDSSGNAFMAGVTTSSDFPVTAGAFDTTCPGACASSSGFLTKLNSAGSALLFSTYLGGSSADVATSIALGLNDVPYVAGGTNSSDFPITSNGSGNAGGEDGFISLLDNTGSGLIFSSQFGGSGNDIAYGLAVDSSQQGYVAGSTQSSNFPTMNAFQSSFVGNTDAFALLATDLAGPFVIISPTSLNFGTVNVGSSSSAQTVTISNTGNATLTFTSITLTGANPGDFSQTNSCSSVLAGATCTINVTFKPTAAGTRDATLSIEDNALSSPQTVSLSGTGQSTVTGPVVSLSPGTLTFASQVVDTTSTAQSVTLTNTGTSSLSITSIGATGDFAETNTCGASVAAGGSCTISVTFTPTTTGTRTGSISVSDNAPGSPQGVSLSGTGALPTLTFSAASLTFGNQVLTTTSAAQTVTVSANGPVTFTSIVASGDFAQTNTCGTSLALGATCTISVTFTPTATGTRTGAITLTDSGSASPQTVSLTGTGVAPTLTFSLSSLTFGNQVVGTTSAAQTVTVSTNGPVTFTTIAPSGDFAETNTCGTSLALGATCTISVTFTPTATGTRTGAITLTDTGGASPQAVSLTGTGVAPTLAFSSTSLNFGNQGVNTTSAAQTVTVSANGPVTFTSIVASGDFAETNTCGTSLALGATCTISVTFTPTTTGNLTGAITLTDSGSASPQTVSLTGTGISPMATVSPVTLNFGDVAVGTKSAAMSVTLTSSGTSTLTITSITITGADSGDYAETNTCGSSVAVSSTCTISVTFTPAASGTRTATVTVTDNAVPSGTQTVSLTGTGTAPAVTFSPTSLTFASQIVNTTSAPQTVTLTNTGNASLSITSISITGTNSADFSETNTCGSSLAASGACTISVTFTPNTSGSLSASLTVTDNASGGTQTVPISGLGAGFGLTATPSSDTIASGQTANYTVTVTSMGGFSAAVALSCTANAVPLSTCTIAPNSVTPASGSSATATLSVATTAPTALLPDPGRRPWPPLAPHWPWLLGLGLGAMALLARKRRTTLVLSLALLSVMLWASCAGGMRLAGGPGTPVGTYAVTVTGTSNGLTHAATVTVDVNVY